MALIRSLVAWWSRRAGNGQVVFRTPEEAAEFVRRVQKRNGGPNAKILGLWRAYEDAQNERQRAQAE